MFCSSFLLLVLLVPRLVVATKYETITNYVGSDNCTSVPPYIVYTRTNGGCTDGFCYVFVENEFGSTFCSEDDYLSVMRGMFEGSPYIIHDLYSDDDCSTFEYAVGFLATNVCTGGNLSAGLYYRSTFNEDGSAMVIPYFLHAGSNGEMEGDSTCSYGNEAAKTADKDMLGNHSCSLLGNTSAVYDYFTTDSANSVSSFKWYSSQDVDTSESTSSDNAQTSISDNGLATNGSSIDNSSSSGSVATESSSSDGLTTGALTGIIFAAVIVVLGIVVALVVSQRRFKAKLAGDQFRRVASPEFGDTASLEIALSEQKALWNDDIIIAKRIPRDKVKIKKLIRRGAFGEVYHGVFNQTKVAVKMLVPTTRTNLQQVSTFLAEAKVTAIMEHPHIVNLVGVAWDSLSDLCVVLEFMDGGDLRELLNKYEASNHPTGFDRQKAMIALHVCHALTYLHSLSPPLIHRDLKSRNVLLSKTLEAKLTDFGISRERHDQTMTAGVGTSLWMAPEVMMGQRYGDKADMFSFGVVLSELDVHSLPYAQIKKRTRESEGRELPDATLFQRVATGEVHVDFSNFSPRSLVKLGRACTSVDPTESQQQRRHCTSFKWY